MSSTSSELLKEKKKLLELLEQNDYYSAFTLTEVNLLSYWDYFSKKHT